VGSPHRGLVGQLDRGQILPGDEAEDVVGEGGVARQDRAVQVAADHSVGVDAVGAAAGVVAGSVAGAGHHCSQPTGVGTECGDAEVVFEPDELPDAGERAGGDDLADRAVPARCGVDVQHAQSGVVAAAAVPHRLSENLQAGADRQGLRVVGQRMAQLGVSTQPLRREDLGGVLAATQQVHIQGRRRSAVGIDDQNFGGDPAPACPLRENGRIAGVGIGAEDLRYEQADPYR